MSQIRVAVAHMGARRYYLLPQLFYESGMLQVFHTDFFIRFPMPKWFLNIFQKVGLNPVVAMLGRQDSTLGKARVKDYKGLGISFWWQRQRIPVSKRAELFAKVNSSFNQKVLAGQGLKDANVVYAFSGGALNLFQEVGSQSLKVLDQNLAAHKYVENLVAEEQEHWHRWEQSRGILGDNPLIDRQQKEWAIADAIMTPSDFVAASLRAEGVPQEKIDVIPYPVDLTAFPYQIRTRHNGPLRVLFLGNVNLRKGIPYLLEAALNLGANRIQVRVVGGIQVVKNKLTPYDSVASFVGRLPRSAVYQELAWTDLLCLPSLGEGNALVTNEALASGVPVICTPNTGSRVRDGVDGTIVPIRDADAIASALDRYAQDWDLLRQQSEQAVAGRNLLGYSVYKNMLLDTIRTRFHSWKNKKLV